MTGRLQKKNDFYYAVIQMKDANPQPMHGKETPEQYIFRIGSSKEKPCDCL